MLPAVGWSIDAPFATAARVAIASHALTSRPKPTVYRPLPSWWLKVVALPRTAAPPALIAACRAAPAGPGSPLAPRSDPRAAGEISPSPIDLLRIDREDTAPVRKSEAPTAPRLICAE